MTALFTLASAAPVYLRLLRSQYWNQQTQADYIRSHLGETLVVAAKIPFYAERFGGGPRAPDLRSLPILRRSEISLLNRSVRALYPPGTSLASDSSSGSTGMPAEFLFDQSHQRGRFAARARYLRENGWSSARRNVWLIYLGSYMGGEDQALIHTRLLFRTHFLPIPKDFRELAKELRRFDPVYLYAYPAFLDALINALSETGISLPSLRRVFTGAEILDDHVRTRTRKLLGVEIPDNYGSTEAFIAWQCPAGKYHVNAEHVLVEIVDGDGGPAAPGAMGRVLITTLQNRLMPLVRYEIGDYAIGAASPCGCGRTLPTIERVVGRGMNLFRLEDGRLLSPWLLMAALRDRVEVTQFQIVQREIDRFVVKFVADEPLPPTGQDLIRADFVKIIGPCARVEFEKVAAIPRTRGGKFMTALSELALNPSQTAGTDAV